MHTNVGDLTFKLLPEVAPRHVTSLIYLSKIGFYDDVPFHRVCQGFMAQGGDPTGTGGGGPAYKIKAEFNDHRHVRGVLSAARTPDPDSASSQFFVMFGPATVLDHQYSVYGEMVAGEDTLKKFEEVAYPGSGSCPPKQPLSIKSVDITSKPKG
jgi:peptidylprolyl isomerase